MWVRNLGLAGIYRDWARTGGIGGACVRMGCSWVGLGGAVLLGFATVEGGEVGV